jgi:hypothetical protein
MVKCMRLRGAEGGGDKNFQPFGKRDMADREGRGEVDLVWYGGCVVEMDGAG